MGRSLRQLLSAALLLAALLPLTGTDDADAVVRGAITFHGRVVDTAGQPLRGAWVVSRSARRVGAFADSAGTYSLVVPAATLDELAWQPFKLQVEARLAGWKTTADGGDPELGLELQVLTDSLGSKKIRVRSNDARVAAALAGNAVIEGEPVGFVDLSFVGERGTVTPPRAVEMSAMQEVALAGVPASQLPPPVVAVPDPDREEKKRAEAEERAEKKREKKLRAEQRREERQAREAAERKAEAQPPAAANERTAEAKLPEAPAVSKTEEQPREKSATRSERKREEKEKKSSKKSKVVRPGLGGGEVAYVRPSDVRPSDVRPSDVRPSDVRPADQTTRTISSSSALARSVARSRSAGTDSADAAGMPLGCAVRIAGTIEIDWVRPKEERIQVDIFLEDMPDIRTRVQLFMGSPRAFELPPAPCGTHRIGFTTNSKQRFVLGDEVRQVESIEDRRIETRLVLEPVKRKR